MKFKNWVTLCVAFPMAILLVLVNLNVWHGLQTASRTPLQRENHQLHSELEGILSSERVRIRSLASVPITQSLLKSVERNKGSLSIMRRNEANAKIDAEWSTFTRSDIQVRNVLDNAVGDLFRHLSESQERTSRLILTDAAGAVVAASARPPKYDYSTSDWWVKAREATSDRILGEGVDPEGGINLTLAVWGNYETRVLEGVLHETISLQDFQLRENNEEGSPPSQASIVVGKNAWFIRGHSDVAGEAVAFLGDMVAQPGDTVSWHQGFRYITQTLDAGLQWHEPLYVVTLRKESRFPLSILGPLLLSMLGSATLLGSLVYFSNKAGKQMFFDPLQDLVEAGLWVMNRVHKGGPAKLSNPIAKELHMDLSKKAQSSRVVRDLNEWMNGLKQEMQDTVYAQTYEVQKDMELARDFQMAYLNRPYPKVPTNHIEGRLRLGFGHRYEPALALGGDFFDIVTLADDCAGIFIADVMGHGTRSALITAILRTLIGDLSHQGRNARHFISEINKQFCELLQSVPSPQFASCFYFVADTTGRVATFSTAGHHAPYLLRRSTNRITQLTVPEPHGAALGLIPDEDYTGGHTRLLDGDIYLLYTDGFCEAKNADGEEFGTVRMEAILRKLIYRSMDEILDGLMAEVRAFAGDEPFADDICLVAVEATSKSERDI